MTGSRRRGAGALLLAVTFLGGGLVLRMGGREGTGIGGRGGEASPRLFQNVYETIRRHAVDSLAPGDLYELAAEGVLAGLEDDYAELLQGDATRQLAEQTTGNYFGVGLRLDQRGGGATVVVALPNSPAEQAGLRTGDQLLRIDGTPVMRRTTARLRGEAGTAVRLQVRRPGAPQPFEVTLVRQAVHRPSVVAVTLLDSGVAYVAVNPITERSAEELQTTLDSLQPLGMTRLVLDLRGNPGGVLEQGVSMADLFLAGGQEIVAVRGRTPEVNRTYVASGQDRYRNLPMAILINEGTASAAEIVAGALQDHDRALVIGQPSYGKGVVQSVFPLGDSAALRLTTGRWYTPSGRTIQAPSPDGGSRTTGFVPLGDTAISARPLFRTDQGREVRGGGGIVPDLVVGQDNALQDAERRFLRDLGDRYAGYRKALTGLALELRAEGVRFGEDVVVTPALRDRLVSRLRDEGIVLSTREVEILRGLLDRALGNEIARYVIGREAEVRRRLLRDRQAGLALQLLRRSPTVPEMFEVARTVEGAKLY